jgi:hypothetical protein
MKPIVRSALFCLALALLLPFTALAADGNSADEAPTVVSQDEVAMTPLDVTSTDSTADQVPAWLEPPEWTKDEVTVSFGNCPGPPVLSCQCGPGLGEPGSEACCYCNTCWDGYVLALCGLDP